jgi:hypothetical protein
VARRDDNILTEIKSLSLETIEFYDNEPPELDLVPFEGREGMARMYAILRAIKSKEPATNARSMIAQANMLRSIFNWDSKQAQESVEAITRSPPEKFEQGLTPLEASIVLARMSHNAELGKKNISIIQEDLESKESPQKFTRWFSRQLFDGKSLEELEADKETLRLWKYWKMQKEGYLTNLLYVAQSYEENSRMSIDFDGRLLSN